MAKKSCSASSAAWGQHGPSKKLTYESASPSGKLPLRRPWQSTEVGFCLGLRNSRMVVSTVGLVQCTTVLAISGCMRKLSSMDAACSQPCRISPSGLRLCVQSLCPACGLSVTDIVPWMCPHKLTACSETASGMCLIEFGGAMAVVWHGLNPAQKAHLYFIVGASAACPGCSRRYNRAA